MYNNFELFRVADPQVTHYQTLSSSKYLQNNLCYSTALLQNLVLACVISYIGTLAAVSAVTIVGFM
jgi:hypothetical protein